ncbi:C69 family dipeptidase [Campylobacter mucosalis]|uniref:Dipeptidase n=1 Tax=Campylobacter mucosalis CCUG 21559 TaxID=1032067 RepID=A0A6G5QHG9_9BACT|nr:C69 family dipeptidase [Campylobacter mucosalis]QCD45143.1 peptidase D [Campylobacter mucosalis CCUG 21559]
MRKTKLVAISAVLSVVLSTSAFSCTTILVGEEASSDGSLLIARSADSKATKAQLFLIHPEKHNQTGIHSSKAHQGANDFTYPLPKYSMRYTTVPNWQTKLHGAVGYNDAGVGISGTETIYAKDELLKIDPYNEEKGITEDDIPDVLLPRMKSAKEGVMLLGEIIETIGAGEGFGVAFVDKDELWYLETGTGHQWIAVKIPKDVYFSSGNQGRLREYEPNNPNFLASKNLIEFAIKNGAYDPSKDGKFDFKKAYTRDDERDVAYNYPRVWWVQKMFNPSLKQEIKDGSNFPVYLKPEKKLSVDDLKAAMRSHYDGTKYDPYVNQGTGDNIYRTISVFRTYESHVMQVRPWLPQEIGRVSYVAIGMADLSVYLPYYYGIDGFIDGYDKGTNKADDESIYWVYRKLQTLVMTDYNKYSPIVKKAYADFEAKLAIKQAQMEKEYVIFYKTDKKKANKLLNDFSKNTMSEAKELTKKLTNEIFTQLTDDIDTKFKQLNKGKKD